MTYYDTGAPGTWRDALLHSPCLNISEYRPLAPFDSGHSAAAVRPIHLREQAAGGITGCITALRMDGNAEPCNDALSDSAKPFAPEAGGDALGGDGGRVLNHAEGI